MSIELIKTYSFALIKEMWFLCAEMAPYLLLGMFFSGLISIFVDNSFIFKHIGSKNFLSVLKSTLFGIPLPLCSCGVIPVAATLREGGASKGSTVSFLVSTPQTGVDSILLTYGMMGPVFAVFRPLAALFSGMFSGIIINQFDDDRHHHVNSEQTIKEEKEDLRIRLVSGLKYGFISLPSDIVVPLFQGLVVAALISVTIPPDFIASHFSSSPLMQYTMLLAISIPIYVCATASIPIAVALLAKGLSPGSIFIFLMAGPATNASSIAIIKNILGKKTLYYYLGLISFTAVLFGIVLDSIFKTSEFSMPDSLHYHDHSGIFSLVITIIFLAILINSYFFRFRTNNKVQNTDLSADLEQISFRVDGMTCGHCQESVETAANSFNGVKTTKVDLVSGEVNIYGIGLEEDSIKKKITDRGFTIN